MKRSISVFYCLVVLFSLLLIGSGIVGLKLNELKVSNVKNNEILLELASKLKSGELQIDNKLGLVLIDSINEAHVDAAAYVGAIYKIYIGIGGLLFVTAMIFGLIWYRTIKRQSST
ncbi:hypothetical protein [Parashewanella tropica]|uniref:hypothetical protein n=1 Tax=Parashewanella tropica TaxID=2547970 RepID=UPI00105A53F9|nr:hypothetical protein [Parashewanella tropica]